MPYINKPSGRFGYSPEIAMASRGVSPNWAEEWIWYEPSTMAHDDMFQRLEETTPLLVGGTLTQQWRLLPADAVHITAAATARAQARLDGWARTRNYDGVLSLATYANSAVPRFAAEAARGIELRDATWAKLYEILTAVQAGERPMPRTWAALEQELPPLIWPDAAAA
ncbi:hypothetical protein SAMN05192589_107107 [Paracidovorax valerianellae]|uniref:Uncharacterized protein n=1 Tax=Paracidovorax valerianellae TaxID=187868 RepID=A0A1G6VRT6_9BURK|nr:hypothetical protein [Paracidovorax valerianellae]SDD55697.1 hypothetical protein SAMN05192589_107107 [Paracidovorax valerianellae]